MMSLGKVKVVFSVLALGATLSAAPQPEMSLRGAFHHRPSNPTNPILMIRVSQESNPGVGDFDQHILGFVRALQTLEKAADFYRYDGHSYGNSSPLLTPNRSHLYFLNAADGLAFVVVHNTVNRAETGNGGAAHVRWELSGGTAELLVVDDSSFWPSLFDSEAEASQGGTVFIGDWKWPQSNTDGMLVGPLPVGFTLLGQFEEVPIGLDDGWEAISNDGTCIPLQLVVGRRVRLDVALHVQVRQDR